MNFRLKFIRWLFPSIVGILALWMIGGNLLADYLEKDIKQEIEEYAQQFSYTEPNDSALKLQAILAKKMGISVFGSYPYQGVYKIDSYTDYHPDFKRSKLASNDDENIQEKLTQYLDAQIAKPNDEIDVPPAELQRYLASQGDGLAAIKDHLLNNEVPQWEEIDFLAGDYSVAHPSYLSLANIQKIMALDILEKTRLGKNQEALEMLEVSWKINKSLDNYPTLFGQLVALIMGKYQAGVIRKLDYIPPEWQQRLLDHDYRQSILKSIEGEYIMAFKFLNKMDTGGWEDWYDEDEKLIHLLLRLKPLSRPYLRFSAINSYYVAKEGLVYFPTQNVCLSTKTPNINGAWWNLALGRVIEIPSFLNQEFKAEKYMLELEFTQKILQVKEIAAKQGKWPDSVPNLESSFCPGYRWVYQVSEDGTMSISLNKKPEWVGEMSISLNEKPEWAKDRTLPLTYSDKTIPKLPKK